MKLKYSIFGVFFLKDFLKGFVWLNVRSDRQVALLGDSYRSILDFKTGAYMLN